MSPPPQFAQILVHRAAFPSPPQRFPSAQQAPPHPSGQQIEQIHITRAHGGALRGGPPRGAQARDDVRERALDASARSWDLNSPQSASRPENPLAPGFVFALQGLRRLLSRSAIVAQISQSGLYGGYHRSSARVRPVFNAERRPLACPHGAPKRVAMQDLTLYQFELCPYCHKVRAGLELKGLAFRKVEVNPMSKSHSSLKFLFASYPL